MSHIKKKRSGVFPVQKFLKLFFIYFILFLALLAMVDYYAMMFFNLLFVVGVAIIIALPAAYVHISNGKHTHIDDVADELL